MPGPNLASAGSDWSYGGSILTFLFPMILFLAVAGVLWVLYTKPQHVPGRSYHANERSVIATPTVTAVAATAGSPGGAGTQPAATAAGGSAGRPGRAGRGRPLGGRRVTQATSALPGHGHPQLGVASGGRRPVRLVARSLFLLTKPRIIELLLVTTVPTMLLAKRGLPSAWLLAATLLGGALAAASANTLNCYLDRDIDAVMKRTSRRPLVAKGTKAPIKPYEALVSGVVLGALSTVLLGVGVNWLAAALADGAILFYVFVYTLGLKRRTPSNIVIGGAAGCFPVLVGWAAVTG